MDLLTGRFQKLKCGKHSPSKEWAAILLQQLVSRECLSNDAIQNIFVELYPAWTEKRIEAQSFVVWQDEFVGDWHQAQKDAWGEETFVYGEVVPGNRLTEDAVGNKGARPFLLWEWLLMIQKDYLHLLKRGGPLKFVDIGSGSGKAVILAALSTIFQESLGVEINPDLWDVSNTVKARWNALHALTKPTPVETFQKSSVDFICGDATQCSDRWSDAQVLFMNVLTWNPGLVKSILHLVKPGTLVMVVGHASLADDPSLQLSLLDSGRMECSWSDQQTINLFKKRGFCPCLTVASRPKEEDTSLCLSLAARVSYPSSSTTSAYMGRKIAHDDQCPKSMYPSVHRLIWSPEGSCASLQTPQLKVAKSFLSAAECEALLWEGSEGEAHSIKDLVHKVALLTGKPERHIERPAIVQGSDGDGSDRRVPLLYHDALQLHDDLRAVEKGGERVLSLLINLGQQQQWKDTPVPPTSSSEPSSSIATSASPSPPPRRNSSSTSAGSNGTAASLQQDAKGSSTSTLSLTSPTGATGPDPEHAKSSGHLVEVQFQNSSPGDTLMW
jgi:hypothetical protein